MTAYKIVPFALVLILIAGIGYWHFTARPTFPPKSDVCFDMLTSSLESARSNPAITVPAFPIDSITRVRCAAAAGLTTFAIEGTDSAGKQFSVFETVGGKAASGADSVFDYCYTQNGKVISQARITGREGKRSDSACAYDTSLIPHPAYSYEYGS